MATSTFFVALAVTLYPWSAQCMRVQHSSIQKKKSQAPWDSWWGSNDTDTPALPEGHTENCCCKQGLCNKKPTTSTTDPVYSPNYGVCCKFKDYACGSILNGRTSYRDDAPQTSFCVQPKPGERFGEQDTPEPHTPDPDGGDDAVVDEEPLRPVSDLVEGTSEHTVQSYCDFDTHDDDDAEDEAAAVQTSTLSNVAKNSIVSALVSELDKNSLDSMAKDMFSMYFCVRWAPTPAFVNMANGEMRTKQLAAEEGTTAYSHFDAFTFIPLRCSKNINVYGNNPALGKTQFEQFEKEMMKQSAWHKAEAGGAVAARLQNMQDKIVEPLEESAKAFDVATVRKKVASCQKSGASISEMTVDTFNAPASELLKDCAAANWWLEKMEDWNAAMPFTSFMTPAADVAKNTKPKGNEHVLVCFGKRVSSQLHRRAEGTHLITDQSMVGCHGFWKFGESSAMLERIVKLWKPPTCQLASLELDMKMRMMEMISTMNTQLFDALPAMLDAESTSKVVDEDGNPLQSASASGVVMGLATSIGSLFSSMSSKYERLGQMLGGTTVKWVVCPLKPITDTEKLRKLDMALGSEDDLARHYAKTAYAKWTGKQNLLPGEECTGYQTPPGAPAMPRPALQRCSVAEMEENKPEPYKDVEFICPARPLLPAKQQLKVLQKKVAMCPLRLDATQQKGASWFYYGRKPHLKQYDVMQNFPHDNFQSVKILDMVTRYDSTYYVTRTFVTVGRGCTEEEAVATPRFCSKPEVANEPSIVTDLLTGGLMAGNAAVSAGAGALRLAGVMEATPSNAAYKERIKGWLSSTAKNSEQWLRSNTDAMFGRSSGRYTRMRTRSFAEVEANELMHSLSFQSEFAENGANTTFNKRFDRFAVMAPCGGFDPNREFRLKYSWSEKAITLARKSFQKLSDNSMSRQGATGFGSSSRAIKVQLRSDAVLRMSDPVTAWVEYFAHIRAANVGDNFQAGWMMTNNPYLLDMAGIFDGHSDKSLSVDDLLGYEATFACGTRVEMHALGRDFASLTGSFKECVKNGKDTNKALRDASPEKPFLKDEVVIRVTFKSMEKCHMEMSASMPAEEQVNPVYTNFAKITKCNGLVNSDLAVDLVGAKGDATFRGMIQGSGMPEETLVELLVDPEDFLQEVTL